WLILPPQSAIKVGTLVAFITLMQNMFKPTKKIIKEWNTVGKIYASVERIGELLDRKPAVQDAPNAVEAPPLRGDVEFRHVGFAYQPEAEDMKPGAPPPPLRMTLKDVNFHVPPGGVVALVGPTGAGKSTILQLLPRLYDPHTGQILIDGHDSREFTMDSLRGQMSMVLQESILFVGSIADNIAYGRTGATREEIIAAAIQANAHEFIEKLPEGYDTLLGERAGNLSGGQRQRLAIARAFIRNTPILILDEPTTGLDAESTDLVLLALRTLMKGKTTLIISHDLNLIRHVDQILVLKDGQIIQTGTHKELLKAGGLYADLYNMQFGRAAEEAGTPLPKAAAPEPEAEPDADVVSPVAFQTMLMQALPLPVTSQAFETLATQKPRLDTNGAGTEHPASGLAAPAAPAAASKEAPPPETGRAPIFQTTMMRVLPRRGPQDGTIPKEARMSDQAPIATPASPPAQKTDGHAYIPAVTASKEAPAAPANPDGGVAVAAADAPPAALMQGAPPAVVASDAPPAVAAQAAPPAGASAGPPAAAPPAAAPEAPRRRDPQSIAEVGGAPVDPLQSPLLRQDLPGLAEAFDGEAMRERLQVALFGKTNPNYTIERATPGQAIYQPGESCVLRYSLEVRDSRSGDIFKPLIVARVFPTQAASTVYKRDRLDPLRALMRGREEIAPFAQPVALIRPLNMVVYVFPIDGQLPTLIGATDRERVVEILRETLPDALMGDFEVEDCRIEPGHYGRMHRCVFRYYVHGRRAGSDEPETQLVYGKVADDGSGALTGPVIAALRERVLDSSSPYHFNIPHALGYRPDLQLLLLEAIPGAPQVAPLLAARLRGEDARVGTTTLEDMHEACARIAVALHTSGIKLGRRRTFDDEMTVLRDGFAAMRTVSPELAAQLQGWLDRLAVVAEQSDAMPLCFSHGDFTYTQLIFDGTSSGLVDFDTVCQAEPAIDLGQFLAYLRVAVQKAHRNAAVTPTALADDLGEVFYDAYVAAADTWLADEEQLRARTAVYEIVSLLRLALHSWQKLKAARIQNVLAVLEERMACLQ
ncbi:MAG TPA: ATP-binding cassette domain-containing protein, partial [Chloroflexia bacterium]|nr:ATP-binding cassette domain-containing protein [Chloroflexia bacterium]